MPCCGRTYAPQTRVFAPRQQSVPNIAPEDCTYTLDILNAWTRMIVCFKDKALYLNYKIAPSYVNKALGIVLSAKNYPSNPCYFQDDLDQINEKLIILIIGIPECQTS